MDIKSKNLYILLVLIMVAFLFSSVENKKNVALSQPNKVSQTNEGYYSHRPSGCGSIKKLKIEEIFDYFLVQTCSREGGMWLQQVTTVETKTSGIIYLKGEKLLNGGTLSSGYWCSLKAPGSKEAGMISKCTKNGWVPNK
jgi:hypothetical protein